jgi:hypothetical protein
VAKKLETSIIATEKQIAANENNLWQAVDVVVVVSIVVEIILCDTVMIGFGFG